jgi:hypothetical protein
MEGSNSERKNAISPPLANNILLPNKTLRAF